MKRRLLAVTGSRAEYGSMRPVYRALAAHPAIEIDLVVTGMHLAPAFAASLAEIERDAICPLHIAKIDAGDTADMARTLGAQIAALAPIMDALAPDAVLLQGDRGEMLAAAITAAHRNTAVAHMSGGDRTGSIDDSIRNAITSFAHVHLTTCASSSERLLAMGEAPQRIFEVGEPALDVIRTLQPLSPDELAARFGIDISQPFALATQHPVTTEAADSAAQVVATLHALETLELQTLFTYPNTDSGSAGIIFELEAWHSRGFLRLVPHVGQHAYLSLMKAAAVMVGNSSSGLLEAASFHLPVVNIGTRQHGRLRPANVIDVGYDTAAIRRAIEYALHDETFRRTLSLVNNPYGDGACAGRTADILANLSLGPALIAKWLAAPPSFLG